MKWRDSTRVGDPSLDSCPVGKPTSRATAPRNSLVAACDSMTIPPEQPRRRPPVTIVGAVLGAIGGLIGSPQVPVGFSSEDEHPGWNLSDKIDLPPHGECRYLVEFVSGQTASIEVASTHAVTIAVCDDDDYDFRPHREWYASRQTQGPELEKLLLEYEDGTSRTEGWPRPTSGPTTPPKTAKIGPTRPKLRNRRIS